MWHTNCLTSCRNPRHSNDEVRGLWHIPIGGRTLSRRADIGAATYGWSRSAVRRRLLGCSAHNACNLDLTSCRLACTFKS